MITVASISNPTLMIIFGCIGALITVILLVKIWSFLWGVGGINLWQGIQLGVVSLVAVALSVILGVAIGWLLTVLATGSIHVIPM